MLEKLELEETQLQRVIKDKEQEIKDTLVEIIDDAIKQNVSEYKHDFGKDNK